eukprot:738093-Pelagomonas_calceolata.AAC.1
MQLRYFNLKAPNGQTVGTLKCQMPSQLISIIKDLYQDDTYILIDGDKRASFQPTHSVKQGCLLSPILFSIYANDVGHITEGATGAMTSP